MSELSVVDLFCGCDGMSLGFERAGFHMGPVGDDMGHRAEHMFDEYMPPPSRDYRVKS